MGNDGVEMNSQKKGYEVSSFIGEISEEDALNPSNDVGNNDVKSAENRYAREKHRESISGRVLTAIDQKFKKKKWFVLVTGLFFWLALVFGVTYCIIEYGIVGDNPQWDKADFANPLAMFRHNPMVILGAASISDKQKCLASFATLQYEAYDFDSYDKYFAEDSDLVLPQAGGFVGVENIKEYIAFASSLNPGFSKVTTPLRDIQFEKYDSDTGICVFYYYAVQAFQINGNIGRAEITGETAFTLTIKYDMNQNYIKTMYYHFAPQWFEFFFGVAFDSDKSREHVCSIMSGACGFEDNNCAEKLAALPTTTGSLGYFDENSQGCRIVHSTLALSRPELHCPHISLEPMADLNNKTKCQNSSGYGYLPENYTTVKQLDYFHKFQADYGLDPELGYKIYDCGGDCSVIDAGALATDEKFVGFGDGTWKVTDTDPVSRLDIEEFRVYLGFVTWFTVLLAGIGSELLVFLLYLRKTGWDDQKEAMWKIGQFVFPLLAATTFGLAIEESFLALPFLVIGLWKFGFPETVLYMYIPLIDPNSTTIGKVSDFLNGTGTFTHHGAPSFLICMLVTGVAFPDKHVISPILILLMQHWFVLSRYVNATFYIVMEMVLEFWFEWIVISNFQYLIANHWTVSLAAGVMLFAHWEYLLAAVLAAVNCKADSDSDNRLLADHTMNRLSIINDLQDEEIAPMFRDSTMESPTRMSTNGEDDSHVGKDADEELSSFEEAANNVGEKDVDRQSYKA